MEKLIELTEEQKKLITDLSSKQLIEIFAGVTKVSDMTIERGYSKLNHKQQSDALILYIEKQPITHFKQFKFLFDLKIGSIKAYTDGAYILTKKGWRKQR